MTNGNSDEAAARAAALLDAAPGMYGLRKRQRGPGRQTADLSSSPVNSPSTSPDMSLSTLGPSAAAEGIKESELGSESPSQVDATKGLPTRSKSLLQPAPVASSAQKATQPLVEPRIPTSGLNLEADDDDSSLTSLSDLEERFSIKDDEGARATTPDKAIPAKKSVPRKRQTTVSSISSQATSASPAESEYRPAPESDHDDDDDEEATGPPLPARRVPKNAAVAQDIAFRPSRVVQNPPGSKTATASTKGKTPVKARKALSQSPILPRPSIRSSKPVPPKSVPLKRTSPTAIAQPAKAAADVPAVVAAGLPLPRKRQPSLPALLAAPVPQFPSDFLPGAMPYLAGIYDKREEILAAIREAGNTWDALDGTLQSRSERQIESALEALGPEALQRGLCLIMNRYSAFCATSEVRLQPFPITAAKVALFLGRSPATLESSKLRAAFPQPPDYPLPVAGYNDFALKPEEGSRVSRELVRFWIEALDYAQRATSEIWAPFLNDAGTEIDGSETIPFLRDASTSLGTLADDVVVREIVNAVETSDSIERSQERAAKAVQATRQSAISKAIAEKVHGDGMIRVAAVPPKGSTKWTKGGKAVAPPPSSRSSSSTNTPLRDRNSPRTMGDPSFLQPGQQASATSTDLVGPQSPVAYEQPLAIPSAPIGLGIQHLPVASSSRQTLDHGHRRRSATSDLMHVDDWSQAAVPSALDERPGNLPTPLSIEDTGVSLAPISTHDLAAWAQHYLHQTLVDNHFGGTSASGSLSTPAYSEAVGQWTTTLPDHRPHFSGPYGSGSSSGRPSISISEVPEYDALPLPQQNEQRGDVTREHQAANRPDHARVRALGATPAPSRSSSIDMLAAVASSYGPEFTNSSTMDWNDFPASVEGIAASEQFGQPVGSASLQSAPVPGLQFSSLSQWHQPVGHQPVGRSRGVTTTAYDQGVQAFEAASSYFLGQDPSLVHFLHARSQSHPPAFASSDSRFGHIVDQALGSLADAQTFDSLAGTRPYPPAYPTPDSPIIERWSASGAHIEPYQPQPSQAVPTSHGNHLTPYASASTHYAFPDTSEARSATAAPSVHSLDFSLT